MTLVLQTSDGTDPRTNAAIQAVLGRFNLQSADAPLELATTNFSWFNLPDDENSESLIAELMALPGVEAAYIKPMGTPPM